MRHSLGSEIGLAHFGVETKHETKLNLPNSADNKRLDMIVRFWIEACELVCRLGYGRGGGPLDID